MQETICTNTEQLLYVIGNIQRPSGVQPAERLVGELGQTSKTRAQVRERKGEECTEKRGI